MPSFVKSILPYHTKARKSMLLLSTLNFAKHFILSGERMQYQIIPRPSIRNINLSILQQKSIWKKNLINKD